MLSHLLAKGNSPMTNIIEKIQKLQALADRAGTEHEAALAAERVAQLCQQHNLDIGVATLVEEEKEASEAQHVHETSRWQAHWWKLGKACERLFGVGCYAKNTITFDRDSLGVATSYHRWKTMVFYGLKANVEAATVTYRYLLASVETLLEGHIRNGHPLKGPSDFRSFRLGCAVRIMDEAGQIKAAAERHFTSNEETKALVLLGSALMASYEKKHHFHTTHSAPAGNHDHYGAGYDAGAKVDLHGAKSSRMLGAAKS
jgi:hypothetical protein